MQDITENYFYYGTYLGSIGCIKVKDENEIELISELNYQKEQFDVVDIKVARSEEHTSELQSR